MANRSNESPEFPNFRGVTARRRPVYKIPQRKFEGIIPGISVQPRTIYEQASREAALWFWRIPFRRLLHRATVAVMLLALAAWLVLVIPVLVPELRLDALWPRKQTYYDVLGVSPLAGRREIEAAFASIKTAYDTLSGEPHVRCLYDLEHDIEGLWPLEDCLTLRKVASRREVLRRQRNLEETERQVEQERLERQLRFEERLERQERLERSKSLAGRAKAVLGHWAAVFQRFDGLVGDPEPQSF